ncbi:hypothetical protein [Pantoea dispersa]|uniref:hypothetical protein n=1 Tax=Pantoea dispersa TaxID=59814 RepID=UPI001BA466E2|nr:hypothetical protein [Pantoea dispersa]MBS0899995.1 hypothetical protein [Pantoea dispersa]
MSKGTFQNYQHYLPATYIRRFKITSEDPKAGKDTVYGFVKKDATKEQVKKRITFLNVTKICGQERRHTLNIEGVRDNFIEDTFKILEDCYPGFVDTMWQFYKMKENFKNASGSHYFVRRHCLFGDLALKKFARSIVCSGLHEIDFNDLKNMAIFMARFLCYRNKSMDYFFDKSPMPKLKNINTIIKEVLNTNKDLIPYGASIIPRSEWKSLLSILKEGGEYLVNADSRQRREMFHVLRKMHRFMALPFSSIANESGCRAYLYSAPKGCAIVSSDFPFIFFKNDFSFGNGCIFTISPRLALIFKSAKITLSKPEKLSNLISMRNVIQARQYVFSVEKERLDIFTKDITPILTESYGKRK